MISKKGNFINSDSDLHFFVELSEFKKGKDKKGKDVMKVSGIASTKDRDGEGEILDPEGFNFKPFLKSGFLNWHHQSSKNPLSIVGQPTKAKVVPEGFYIEGNLYEDNPMAQQIWKLAQVLEKNSPDRRLGFSIEGKALKRNKLDPKKIEEAVITGCAITHAPINKNTLMSIAKGEQNEGPPVFDIEEYVELEKSVTKAGNILELEKDGKLVVVTKDYGVKITNLEKKEGDEDEEEEKALSTSNAAPLLKESLDKEPKKLKGDMKNNQVVEMSFSLDEMQRKIKTDFSGIIESDTKIITDLVKAILKSQNHSDMSMFPESALSTAYEALGLTSEVEQKVEKGDVTATTVAGEQTSTKDVSTELQKGGGSKEKKFYFKKTGDYYRKCYKGDDGKEQFADDSKYEKKGEKTFMKMKEMKKGEEIIPIDETVNIQEAPNLDIIVEKAKTTEPKNHFDLEKAFSLLGIQSTNQGKAIGQILKGVVDKMEGLEGRLDEFMRQPSVPGQRAISKAGPMQVLQRNFTSDGDNITKGGEAETDSNVYDLSNPSHKLAVQNILDSATFEKGEMDVEFSDATLSFEAGSNSLSANVIARLKNEKGITVKNPS